jgi:hypothetical protein
MIMKTKTGVWIVAFGLLTALSFFSSCDPPWLDSSSSGDDDFSASDIDSDGDGDSDVCQFDDVASIPFPAARSLILKDSYLYALNSGELAVIDVSDTTTPHIVSGDAGTINYLRHAELYDDRLYVVGGDWEWDPTILWVFDVSDPTTDPPLLATVEESYTTQLGAMAPGNDRLYIASHSSNLDTEGSFPLLIFKTSNVTLEPIEYTKGTGHFTALSRNGDRLYAGYAYHNYLQANALIVLDISEPDSPEVVQELSMPGIVSDLRISGGMLFVSMNIENHSDATTNFGVYDLTDPDLPNLVESTMTDTSYSGHYPSSIAYGGGFIYARDTWYFAEEETTIVSHEGDLQVFEKPDDGAITLILNDYDNYVWGVALDRNTNDGLLYLGHEDSIDVVTRCNPQ